MRIMTAGFPAVMMFFAKISKNPLEYPLGA